MFAVMKSIPKDAKREDHKLTSMQANPTIDFKPTNLQSDAILTNMQSDAKRREVQDATYTR